MSGARGDPPITLAQLLRAEVVDDAGRRVGHVFDVRIARAGDGEAGQIAPYRVEGLIVGRRGLRARLGTAATRGHEPLRGGEPLPWRDVVALAPGRVVVRRRDAG